MNGLHPHFKSATGCGITCPDCNGKVVWAGSERHPPLAADCIDCGTRYSLAHILITNRRTFASILRTDPHKVHVCPCNGVIVSRTGKTLNRCMNCNLLISNEGIENLPSGDPYARPEFCDGEAEAVLKPRAADGGGR